MSKSLFQSRWTWILFLSLALAAALGGLKIISQLNSNLQLDLTFSREQALEAAKQLAKQHFPDVNTTRSAVIFAHDEDLQNYVELEAGGTSAFQALMDKLDADTHCWKVRLFTPGQQEEIITTFSPHGVPISYRLTIPQNQAGAALDEDAARSIAERGARELMGERFDHYAPLESQNTRQDSGRVDYNFTYENQQLKIGDARFRLKLSVAGKRLLSVEPFIYIPDAFHQRFGKMRALNTLIGQYASFFLIAVLVLGGVGGGGIWLYRQRALKWRKALIPGFFVATGMAAMILSNLPMAWMSYQTTSSAQSFLLQNIVTALAALGGLGLAYGTIYSVAEGLSRKAFPTQPKLFSVFSSDAAASTDILGRVLGALGWTGFFLCYAGIFIVFSTKVLGWWMPASTSIDPNILASWRPALQPIFVALQAGTWEECVFRAIPLSLAAIVGARFNMRTPLIVATLIIQAIAFGSAHANYPNLPGYSRIVELFIPALVFGLVYLRFGLLVGMLAHFEYDLTLMSSPIFSASDSGLWFDRALVILAGSAPLIILLWARYRQGAWISLPDKLRNAYEEEEIPSPDSSAKNDAETSDGPKPLALQKPLLIAIAVLAIVAIGINKSQPPKVDWPMYQVNRAQAKQIARETLSEHGVALDDNWHMTISTGYSNNDSMNYVWQAYGREVFQNLLGTYVSEPEWDIKWRNFGSDADERSEVWTIKLDYRGKLKEIMHELPESRAGKSLTREQAIALAQQWIEQQHWQGLDKLTEKSVEQFKRPARLDWKINYVDNSVLNDKAGRALISIAIAGDEVTYYERYVDVPEAWSRQQEEKASAKKPFTYGAVGIGVLLFGISIASFFMRGKRIEFSLRAALPWLLVFVPAQIGVSWLWIDKGLESVPTTIAWTQEIVMIAVGIGFNGCITGTILFFAVQVIYVESPRERANLRNELLLGFCAALAIYGLSCLAQVLLPPQDSPSPYSADFSTALPWLTAILNAFKRLLAPAIQIVILLGLTKFARKPWQFIALAIAVVAFLGCLSLGSTFTVQALVYSLPKLCGFVLMFELLRRGQLGAALLVALLDIAFGQFGVANASYPLAPVHALIAGLAMTGVSLYLARHWYTYIGKQNAA